MCIFVSLQQRELDSEHSKRNYLNSIISVKNNRLKTKDTKMIMRKENINAQDKSHFTVIASKRSQPTTIRLLITMI